MVALWNRADRYIFILWFLLSICLFFLSFFFFFFFPRLISAVGDWMSAILPHVTVWPQSEFRMQCSRSETCCTRLAGNARRKKNRQKVAICAPSNNLSGYILATKARIDNRKNSLSTNISSRCPHNMVNFGLLATEIDPVVWGTPANFNSFHVLAALLHVSQVVTASQTLRRWTEGATYVRQGDHHIGHWPTF